MFSTSKNKDTIGFGPRTSPLLYSSLGTFIQSCVFTCLLYSNNCQIHSSSSDLPLSFSLVFPKAYLTSPPECLNLLCPKPNFWYPPLPFSGPCLYCSASLFLCKFSIARFSSCQGQNLRVVPDFLLPYSTSSRLGFFLSVPLPKIYRQSVYFLPFVLVQASVVSYLYYSSTLLYGLPQFTLPLWLIVHMGASLSELKFI